MRYRALAALCVFGGLALAAVQGRGAARSQTCDVTVRPGESVQAAVGRVGSGAVVCLEPGVYVGTVTLESRSDLTIQGAGRGRSILVPSPGRDVLLIFRSRGITVRDVSLVFGRPANAYVWRSVDVIFENVEFAGGEIGAHYDAGSVGRIADSVAHSNRGDGILSRNNSTLTVERSWSVWNGGVGVSSVGETANTTLAQNVIAFNEGPGVFAGVTPCALLPPGQLAAPACYFEDLQAYVGRGNLIMNANLVLGNQSTGLVLFPGTRVTMRGNNIWFNQLTGVFVWAAILQSEGDAFVGNEEHAVEVRAYPDPLSFGKAPAPFPWRPAGRINNARITNQFRLDERILGGGVLSQGGNLSVTNSLIADNAGIGVSYVNGAIGSIEANRITGNGGSAICLHNAGAVTVSGNVTSGNLDDRPGVCRER
ncbi:MAG TPA: right-handed parallel beta-helix repeat-containing protein [Dehalococcoidia bacterium]|nr:right-handed parallel beta-helix repeat-containing protein [Dehalococcoidia bacterium]